VGIADSSADTCSSESGGPSHTRALISPSGSRSLAMAMATLLERLTSMSAMFFSALPLAAAGAPLLSFLAAAGGAIPKTSSTSAGSRSA